ncbi:hypothetical protein XENORESO_006691 [Xenotaenia resolanae]|uniref:Uncharacterized protein n=1 Tax=Xenotaenia resolanae TaxID=208358 RepID=A0ABV0VVL6_9TELE
MFKGFGTWLGLEKTSEDKESHSVEQEEKVVEAQNEVNKQQAAEQDDGTAETKEENLDHSKGLGEFIFSFASSATKKLSESVVGTAQTIKKTVEEGKIDGIIDKALCPSGLLDGF